MSFYSLLQYLKYKWHAKGRHSLHSPFVYHIVDTILSRPGTIEEKLEKITANKRVLHVSGQPDSWEKQFKELISTIKPENIVVITDIHQSAEATTVWDRLRQVQEVKLSIDIYKYGLFFFKEEFKEKQHFILKN
jgi:hypothetical protein